MKPFDLNRAKAGDPVVDENGAPARIICFDRKGGNECPIVALVQFESKREAVVVFDEDGLRSGLENNGRLFMAPVRREGWVNVYERQYGNDDPANVSARTGVQIWKTRELADKFADGGRIDCVKIPWEE